ncbi:MAG: hypothetical protein DRJ47_06405 [Thermoprotei archaeon]|nr:MAG: hypothetical protein DRJ47_06405 [Thermoprotei archaeon]
MVERGNERDSTQLAPIECKALILLAKNRKLHIYDIAYALGLKFEEARNTILNFVQRGIAEKEGLFVKLKSEELNSKWIIISSASDKNYYIRYGFLEVKDLLVAPYNPLLEKVVRTSDTHFIAITAAAEEAWLRSRFSRTPINYMLKAEALLTQYIYRLNEGEEDKNLAKESLMELEKARIIAQERRPPQKSELELYANEILRRGSGMELARLLTGIFREKEKIIVDAIEKTIRARV